MFSENTHSITGEKLVEKANELNKNNQGKIVVLAVADVGIHGCDSDVSLFPKTPNEVQALFKKLTS